MVPKAILLSELSARIKMAFEANFPDPLWIIAEISDIRVNQSGHCYLELAEKDIRSDQLLATAKGIIWSFNYRLLKPYFETTAGISLTPGIKVMVQISIEYHELYGLSLNIKDIDPTYTIGEMALKRMEIIRRLESEGVLNMNKEIPLASVIQRIAVISSDTAAGYGDFIDQLNRNSGKFKFYIQLFKAAMQGAKAEDSIIEAFDRIYQHIDFFDAVVIIRGGGAKTDLGCFDSYWLAYHITQFPLPVFTGIGHERDDTIVDLVAHTRLKTPTAVAEFLIDYNAEYDEQVDECFQRLELYLHESFKQKNQELEIAVRQVQPMVEKYINTSHSELELAKIRIQNASLRFTAGKINQVAYFTLRLQGFVRNRLAGNNQNIALLDNALQVSLKKYFYSGKHQLALFEKTAKLQDPDNLLKKGYSFLMKDGKLVRSVHDVITGNTLTNRLSDGDINSVVV